MLDGNPDRKGVTVTDKENPQDRTIEPDDVPQAGPEEKVPLGGPIEDQPEPEDPVAERDEQQKG